MDSLRLDLRYACRSLLRRPGFTALAVLTLAIGIGVNTVAFNAINALLLKPFNTKDADRVGWIMLGGDPNGHASIGDFRALTESLQTFQSVAAEGRLPVSLHTASGAKQAWALIVSANYLATVDARPERGRLFTADDLRQTDLPAVVSHRFWNETLGGGSTVAGRTVILNGRTFSIVGVLPDDHQGRGGLYAPDVWLPLERSEVLTLPPHMRGEHRWLTLFGRLADGVTRAQASSELSAVAAALSAPQPATKPRSARFYAVEDGHPDLKQISGAAWIAMGIVSLVLLIACFNVAALLMARATERQKEIGVRSALGASRGRILRQLVTEGTLLAILAGIATLFVATWSGSLLSTFSLPAPIPQRLHLGIDGTVALFTAVLVLAAGVFPALLPAMQATRANLLRSLRTEAAAGGRPSRTRNVFVVAQVAGSTLFLAAALLFVRSFINSAAFDPGFDTERTVVVQLYPSLYGYDNERARAMAEDLQVRLAALAGVSRVGIADRVPFAVGFPKTTEYSTDAADCGTSDCRRATVYAVGPGHFEALGIPMTHGRDFTRTDMTSGGRVVINEQLAAQLWPGESAVGRILRVGEEGRPVEIIGVSGDIRYRLAMNEPAPALLYRPLTADEWAPGVTVIVRTHDDPRRLLGAVQAQATAVDSTMPVTIATMKERMKMPLWPRRTLAGFFLICGVLALALATVGLFGVLYFTVAQRTREFGIRVALGATSRRVMSVVLREGLTLAVPGVLLGGVAAFAGARLASRMLFGVTPGDPLTFSATVAIEILVALAACALPAYRATKADPMAALRTE